MTDQNVHSLTRKERLFRQLRREILAARLKVTLDKELKRETSPAVKSLAEMKLPPSVRVRHGKVSGAMHGETRRVELRNGAIVTTSDSAKHVAEAVMESAVSPMPPQGTRRFS